METKIEITGIIHMQIIKDNGNPQLLLPVTALLEYEYLRHIPYIRGDSFSSRMLTLLRKRYNKLFFNPTDREAILFRLFGSTSEGAAYFGRLHFSDMPLREENCSNEWLNCYQFQFHATYQVSAVEEIIPDITVLKEGFQMMTHYYLQHSVKAAGTLSFSDLSCTVPIGYVPETVIEQIQQILRKE